MKRRSQGNKLFYFIILFIIFFSCVGLASHGEKSLPVKALVNVRIVDAVNEVPVENGVILIRGNVISDVGESGRIDIPKGAEVFDLSGMTVMPGLIDLHYHSMLYHESAYSSNTWEEPDALTALRAAKNLKTSLEAGVTTVRDIGGVREIPGALKNALALKLFPGPRFYTAGRIITNSGGHAWEIAEVADGKDQIIRTIRSRFPEGAPTCDFIKVTWNLPGGYTDEEIRTAVETTHRYGRKIAIHAFQPESIQACVEYGTDTIEHGWGIDAKTIPLAVKNKTIIVPTMYVVAKTLSDEKVKEEYEGDTLKRVLDQWQKYWVMILDHLKPYVAAGGLIALGTDCGCFPLDFSDAPNELITYRELGLTPFQIVQAGTINAARAIGIEDRTGTLEKGKWADIIVLDGNPLDELESLKKLKMVILDGEVVVDTRAF
ncbi:MAG: amidohydrolase family protein [Candidatus Aminicenantes bacterium]|nr:amidohydrolase family protein [Candidatus Aminicenantes bacterium]